jgi:hypothetical protein
MFNALQDDMLHKVKTNGFRVHDTHDDIVAAIWRYLAASTHRHWRIDHFLLREKESSEIQVYKAKKSLAEKYKVPVHALPFSRGSGANSNKFFFLRPREDHESSVPEDLGEDGVGTLLTLFIKSAMLAATRFGSKHEAAESIGPRVFFGTRSTRSKKSNDIFIDTMEVQLRFRGNVLLPTLSNRRYAIFAQKEAKIASGSLFVGADCDQTRMTLAVLDPSTLTRLDGRKSNIDDIDFSQEGMRQCKLYYLNILAEFIEQVFGDAGLNATRDQFNPTHMLRDGFLRFSEIGTLTRPLIIHNNTGMDFDALDMENITGLLNARFDEYGSSENLQIQYAGIAFARAGISLQPGVEVDCASINTIDPDCAHLFLNCLVRGQAGDGKERVESSIRVGDKIFPNAYAAYRALSEGAVPPNEVDAYTYAKYLHLFSNSTGSIPLQGIDIEFDDKTDSHALADKRESFRRSALELCIKSRFAEGAFTISEHAPQGRFTAIYTSSRKIGSSMQDGEDTVGIVSIVELDVIGQVLSVVGRARHADITRRTYRTLAKEYPCLGEAIVDNAFFLLDVEAGQYLRHFDGQTTPKLLLNAKYDRFEKVLETMESEGGLSAKGWFSRGETWSLIPYYIAPAEKIKEFKWRNAVYVEDRGSGVRYFSPSNLPADGKQGFSNLHDLMVFEEGVPVEAKLLQNRLVQLYLGTLTKNILRINNNSKSSLLEKIARLGAMDT